MQINFCDENTFFVLSCQIMSKKDPIQPQSYANSVRLVFQPRYGSKIFKRFLMNILSNLQPFLAFITDSIAFTRA